MSNDASEKPGDVLGRHKVVDPFKEVGRGADAKLETSAVPLRIYADHLSRIADEAGYSGTGSGQALKFMVGEKLYICRPNGGN